jgi:uncharacterized protein YdaU (DUF1376 family)
VNEKLLAEWFWTDRWTGSSAFLLSLEVRGLYREMLTQSWRRGARLPADPAAIRRAVAATEAEWDRAWPVVAPYWRQTDDGLLVNDTQIAIFTEAQARVVTNRARAEHAAQVRWGKGNGRG